MKIYFIHIPKTGGSSIISALKNSEVQVIGHDIRDPLYKLPKYIVRPGDHAFALTRNPVERCISAYFYLRQGGNSEHDDYDTWILDIKKFDLEQFILKRLKWASIWQMHFLSQAYYLEQVTNLSTYKYETIDESFKQICSKFKFQYVKPGIINKTPGKPDIKLSEKSIRLIKEVYHEDYKLFNY